MTWVVVGRVVDRLFSYVGFSAPGKPKARYSSFSYPQQAYLHSSLGHPHLLSLFSNHSFKLAMLFLQFSLASISEVTLYLSAQSVWAVWAPCKIRVRTTLTWPCAAAKWSGVGPNEPTIRAKVSRCLSV
jgi:hypothetical protein